MNIVNLYFMATIFFCVNNLFTVKEQQEEIPYQKTFEKYLQKIMSIKNNGRYFRVSEIEELRKYRNLGNFFYGSEYNKWLKNQERETVELSFPLLKEIITEEDKHKTLAQMLIKPHNDLMHTWCKRKKIRQAQINENTKKIKKDKNSKNEYKKCIEKKKITQNSSQNDTFIIIED